MSHFILSLEPKPNYITAFFLIAGLPAEMNPHTVALLLWIWKYTDSREGSDTAGKAWASQEILAAAIHVSPKTVQRAFDDAWDWGVISREHIFKKDGKIVISTKPLTKKNTGMGEFQHTRYWLNFDFIRELQANGVVRESTPNENWGSQRVQANQEIGVVRESSALVRESRDGFILRISPPPPLSTGNELLPAAKTAEAVVVEGPEKISCSSPLNPPAKTTGVSRGELRREETTSTSSQRKHVNEVTGRYRQIFDEVAEDGQKSLCERRFGSNALDGSDVKFKTTEAHRREATRWYDARGQWVLDQWRTFLLTENHTVNTSDDSPARTWLLHDFLNWLEQREKVELQA